MLQEGRMPLNSAEHNAVDNLINQHTNQSVSMTRSDPGETGVLLVHVGDDTYRVDEQGNARKTEEEVLNGESTIS